MLSVSIMPIPYPSPEVVTIRLLWLHVIGATDYQVLIGGISYGATGGINELFASLANDEHPYNDLLITLKAMRGGQITTYQSSFNLYEINDGMRPPPILTWKGNVNVSINNATLTAKWDAFNGTTFDASIVEYDYDSSESSQEWIIASGTMANSASNMLMRSWDYIEVRVTAHHPSFVTSGITAIGNYGAYNHT